MATAQLEDPQIQKLISNLSNTNLQFTTVPIPTADATIICNISTGSPRPLVPAQFRKLVFDSLHSLSHPGIRASQKLIKDRYVWPNINSDVRRWARTCLQCQKSKVHRHNVTPHLVFSPILTLDLTVFISILLAHFHLLMVTLNFDMYRSFYKMVRSYSYFKY